MRGQSNVESNAGRCDVCGKPVDMRDGGDGLVFIEASDPDAEGVDKQDMIDAMADGLERVAERGHDHAGKLREISRVFRQDGIVRAHRRCLDGCGWYDLWPNTGDFAEAGSETSEVAHPDGGTD